MSKELANKGNLFDSIDDTTIKEISEATPHEYHVMLANMCNWTATHIKDQNGHYTELKPPIPKTCNYASEDECFDKQQFVLLLNVPNCNSGSFNIALRVTHSSGVVADTKELTIKPDCNYAGEVAYLNIPDPKPK